MRGPRAALAALALVLAACSEARRIAPGEAVPGCTRCHGGAAEATGAPPRDLHANDDPSVPSVGAHTVHVARFGCGECHPTPAGDRAAGHLDGDVDLAFGPLAAADGRVPAYDRDARTCDVYCHGGPASGGSNVRPTWNVVGQGQAACGACHALPPPGHPALAEGATAVTCSRCHPETVDVSGAIVAGGAHLDGAVEGLSRHPAAWQDPSSPAFHGPSAASNGTACLSCHSARPPATVLALACSECHDALAGGTDWTATCNTCHGTAAGAAPETGAHASHTLSLHGVAPAFDCTFCHAMPADVFASGHLDGSVTVAGYSGPDAALRAILGDPGWSAESASCATAYCHGATLSGGSVAAPTWTLVDGSQAACGSCHGSPPASSPSADHPNYVYDAPCVGCHPATATVSTMGGNAVVPGGGAHVDGAVEFTFAGHPAAWANVQDPHGGSHGRNAWNGAGALTMDDYYVECTPCHGATGDFTPAGGTSHVSCGGCHAAFFDPGGGTSCAFCH